MPPREPMLSRDADPGRSAMAWLRSCAARTRWVGRYARATVWPVHFPGLMADAWNASPFDAALAEVVFGELPGIRAPVPHHRRAPVQLPADEPRPYRRFAPMPMPERQIRPSSGALARGVQRRGRKPAVQGSGPATAVSPSATPSRAARTTLARLAGTTQPPVAARTPLTPPIGPAGAQPLWSALDRSPPPDNVQWPRPAMAPALASSAVSQRLGARLTSRMRRSAPASVSSGQTSPAHTCPSEAGPWERRIAASPAGINHQLQQAIASAPDPGPREGLAPSAPAPAGWRTQIAAPALGSIIEDAPAQRAFVARRSSSRSVPGPSGAHVGGANFPTPQPVIDLPAPPTEMPLAARPIAGVLAEMPRGSPPTNAAAGQQPWPAVAMGAAHAAPPRQIIDPVDFAALLRAALLDDARRHGIEVEP
jgi:hypothetical protein